MTPIVTVIPTWFSCVAVSCLGYVNGVEHSSKAFSMYRVSELNAAWDMRPVNKTTGGRNILTAVLTPDESDIFRWKYEYDVRMSCSFESIIIWGDLGWHPQNPHSNGIEQSAQRSKGVSTSARLDFNPSGATCPLRTEIIVYVGYAMWMMWKPHMVACYCVLQWSNDYYCLEVQMNYAAAELMDHRLSDVCGDFVIWR